VVVDRQVTSAPASGKLRRYCRFSAITHMRFTIGEVVVDVVVDDDDFELPLSQFLPVLDLPALSDHRRLLEPDFIDLARNALKCVVQTFVLGVAGQTILVDTCIGEHKDRPEIPAWNQRSGSGYLDRLLRAGVNPASVDTVFCTHLHIDHVGWNARTNRAAAVAINGDARSPP
jgi:glyoxylase-like metal-dependent hydrolase (beta-lactamase superfamily II)